MTVEYGVSKKGVKDDSKIFHLYSLLMLSWKLNE